MLYFKRHTKPCLTFDTTNVTPHLPGGGTELPSSHLQRDVSDFTSVRAEYAHFSPEGHLGIFSVYDIKRGENPKGGPG